MVQKRETNPSSVVDVVEKLTEREYAVNFDFTMEFKMPQLRVGSVRVFGRVESVAPKRK